MTEPSEAVMIPPDQDPGFFHTTGRLNQSKPELQNIHGCKSDEARRIIAAFKPPFPPTVNEVPVRAFMDLGDEVWPLGVYNTPLTEPPK